MMRGEPSATLEDYASLLSKIDGNIHPSNEYLTKLNSLYTCISQQPATDIAGLNLTEDESVAAVIYFTTLGYIAGGLLMYEELPENPNIITRLSLTERACLENLP